MHRYSHSHKPSYNHRHRLATSDDVDGGQARLNQQLVDVELQRTRTVDSIRSKVQSHLVARSNGITVTLVDRSNAENPWVWLLWRHRRSRLVETRINRQFPADLQHRHHRQIKDTAANTPSPTLTCTTTINASCRSTLG
jgi:hypothetical protein